MILTEKVAYCIEPGVDITIHDYDGAVGYINSPYSDEINQKDWINWILWI
ncbi:MAG: hypothetical protein L6V91_06630 [Bacilli bacterium]|nr:MAG: hypothetical protein L6V91_06630 [Bacilli bacterium]